MTVEFNIEVSPNFSFKEILFFLDRAYDDCLYSLKKNEVSRLIPLTNGKALVKIEERSDQLWIVLQKDKISEVDIQEAKNYINEWLDAKREITPFYALLRKHPVLNHFPKTYFGVRLIGIPDLFEAICWAIIGQQINLIFAHQVKRALVEYYGEKKGVDGQLYYLFPTPEVLATADEVHLKQIKLSRQKIRYLKIISQAFINGEMSKSILEHCENRAQQMEKLTAIKGIGLWTANYVLMKTMRQSSCITYGDTGLNKAIHLLFGTDKRPDKKTVDAIFNDFAGWESYLNFYFWRSLY